MARALEFYQLACDWPDKQRSDANACRAIGLVYQHGDEAGVEPDVKRAKSYLRRACRAGLPRACHELGLAMWQPGDPVVADTKRAAKLHRRACKAGIADACVSLAEMLADGHGVKRDLAASAELLEKACTLESGPGCSRLGLLTHYGFGVAGGADRVEAVRLYERACELGDVVGCSAAGTEYAEGNNDSVAEDAEKASRLLSKACLAKYEPACDILTRTGLSLRHDVGVGAGHGDGTCDGRSCAA